MALIPAIALLAFAASRQRAKLLLVGVACVAISVPIVGSLALGQRLGTTFNAQDPSTAGHIERARASIDRVNAHPLGTGLGSIVTFGQSDTGSQQPAESVIFNEDWYLEVGTEVGYLGTALIVIAFVFVLRELWRRGRAGSGPALSSMCALAWVGMGCLVLQVFSDINVSWTLWLAAGLALRAPGGGRLRDVTKLADSRTSAAGEARRAYAHTRLQ
jgi:O-antigen ligase